MGIALGSQLWLQELCNGYSPDPSLLRNPPASDVERRKNNLKFTFIKQISFKHSYNNLHLEALIISPQPNLMEIIMFFLSSKAQHITHSTTVILVLYYLFIFQLMPLICT